jgi:nitrile hydratase
VNGAHDLGGKHGFGAIDRSQQANFEHEWEEKVFGLTLACGMLGQWNLDQSRFARERVDPADYLAASYYEHWLQGLETLLLEQGLISHAELTSGRATTAAANTLTAVTPARVEHIVSTGGPTLMEDATPAQFEPGDRVVVKPDNCASHTRVPGYLKGSVGQIVLHHGSHVFADEHAATGNRVPAHLYGIRFDARELWGAGATRQGTVTADLFEPYLISLEEYLASRQAALAAPVAGDE